MFSSPGFTAIDKTLILSVDLSDHRLPDLTAAQMFDNTTTQRCHHFISASLCPLCFFFIGTCSVVTQQSLWDNGAKLQLSAVLS